MLKPPVSHETEEAKWNPAFTLLHMSVLFLLGRVNMFSHEKNSLLLTDPVAPDDEADRRPLPEPVASVLHRQNDHRTQLNDSLLHEKQSDRKIEATEYRF